MSARKTSPHLPMQLPWPCLGYAIMVAESLGSTPTRVSFSASTWPISAVSSANTFAETEWFPTALVGSVSITPTRLPRRHDHHSQPSRAGYRKKPGPRGLTTKALHQLYTEKVVQLLPRVES